MHSSGKCVSENMGRRKILFIMLDGIGGLPVNDGKTEWEITPTPNLDSLARKGAYGLMHPIKMGVIPGSDTSQLNILGYPPKTYYPGRGPLEALGIGMEVSENDVAFRANFATVDNSFNVIDRRAGRIDTNAASELAKAISNIEIDGMQFIFKNSVEHRGALIVRGNGLSANVEDTDPHATGVQVAQPSINKENAKIVRAINKYTAKVHKILKSHPLNKNRDNPANILLLRGAGKMKKVEPFKNKYGMKACCVAGAALYKGIARYIGMDVINVKGATGTYESDLNAKADASLKMLDKYDFVYLHVKGMDNAGHDGSVKKRMHMIKKIDRMVGRLLSADAVIVATGDHSTPTVRKSHSFEPVPFLVSNVDARDYGIKKFCEVECRKGELGIFNGELALNITMAYAGRVEKYGE